MHTAPTAQSIEPVAIRFTLRSGVEVYEFGRSVDAILADCFAGPVKLEDITGWMTVSRVELLRRFPENDVELAYRAVTDNARDITVYYLGRPR